MPQLEAPIFEVFSAIQGEGLFVGTRQVFVRFCGCNRHCRYCDTAEARQIAPRCLIERSPGSREFLERENPLSVRDVAQAIAVLHTFPGLHDSVSVTGGEPLLYPDFVAALAPLLAALGLTICLETNGTLPDALKRVIGSVGHVAMDIKLESATGEPTPWEAHRRFLDLAMTRGAQVKVVVADCTTETELDQLAETIERHRVQPAVVLQPVTPAGGALPPSPERLLKLHEHLKRRLRDVRVIPQVHKLMGQK